VVTFTAVNIRSFVVRANRLSELVELGTLTRQAAAFLDACVVRGSTSWWPAARKPRGNRDIRSTGAKVSAGAAIPRSHATPAERGKSAVAEHRPI
jgi:hypothetical protein